MTTILLVIHLLIALALVGVIMIQRSEGGALGGLGGTAMGGVMSGRGTANLLTRATAFLATGFMVMSLLLAYVATTGSGPVSILDAPLPATTAPAEPAPPAAPAAPVAD